MRCFVALVAFLAASIPCLVQTTAPVEQRPRTPVTVPDTVALEANIPYDQYADTVLDVMYPKEPSKEKRPCVVVFHGGGWVHSDKESTMSAICLPYLRQGFVVCNIEYRCGNNWGRSPANAPAAVVDCLNATKWFVDHADKYNLDLNRLVSTGASAGGHLALMVGMVTPEAKLGPVVKVAAIVNCYGPTDVNDLIARKISFAVQWLPEQEGREELGKRLSPMTYIRKDLPPILTVQGENDTTVPVTQNVKLTWALKEAGVDAELILLPGAPHGPGSIGWGPANQHIFDFLRKRGIIKEPGNLKTPQGQQAASRAPWREVISREPGTKPRR
jgi:acetyl esterase/lipase